MQWHVPTGMIAAKVGGAALLAVVAVYAAVFGSDPLGVWVPGLAAAAVAVFALRDVIAPVRLAADEEGVTLVVGFARRLRVPWSQVEVVRADVRSRYGLRSEMLEIDVGDGLYLFGRGDLGAEPRDVAPVLHALGRR